MSELLDCGHECTTGYGTTRDGKRHCYTCCQRMDIETMDREGKILGYLSADGRKVTTWTGEPLLTVTQSSQSSAGGFCYGTTITHVCAVDGKGRRWYGRGPGEGMYIRMTRAKGSR